MQGPDRIVKQLGAETGMHGRFPHMLNLKS